MTSLPSDDNPLPSISITPSSTRSTMPGAPSNAPSPMTPIESIPDGNRDIESLEREFEAQQKALEMELEKERQRAAKLERRASQVDVLETKAARLQYALADEQLKVMDLQKQHAKLNDDYLAQYLRADLLESQMSQQDGGINGATEDEKERSLSINRDEMVDVSNLQSNLERLQYELADERMKNISIERRITAKFGEEGFEKLLSGQDLLDGIRRTRDDDEDENDEESSVFRDAPISEKRLQYELAESRLRSLELEKEKERATLRADQLQYELADAQLDGMRMASASPRVDGNGQAVDQLEVDRLKYELADTKMEVIATSRRASVQEMNAKTLQYELADERMRVIELERKKNEAQHHTIGENDEDEEMLRIRKLEYALAEEQMHVMELERVREARDVMLSKTAKERDLLNSQLSQQRMMTLEMDKQRRDSMKEIYQWRQTAEQLEENLHEAQEELEEAKLKTREIENQRRASISSLSQKMWNKLIEKQTEHDEESIHLAKRLQMVEEENARLRKSKLALVASTSQVIDELRRTVLSLSNRLERYEETAARGR